MKQISVCIAAARKNERSVVKKKLYTIRCHRHCRTIFHLGAIKRKRQEYIFILPNINNLKNLVFPEI